jgi:NADH:ubiquinone oxidoreductase subunit 6 (subunit J)
MVMFLFVIAYVGPQQEPPWRGGPSWQTVGAVLAAGAIFLEIIVVLGLKAGGRLSHVDSVNGTFGSPGWIGHLFLTDHLLAFEVTSIVLLIAAVGGVILGEHTKRRDAALEDPA